MPALVTLNKRSYYQCWYLYIIPMVQKYGFTRRIFTRPGRKTLVFNTICTVCSTQTSYYISLLYVKYGMHAYAGPACICRMHAPSMLFRPTQNLNYHYGSYDSIIRELFVIVVIMITDRNRAERERGRRVLVSRRSTL